MNLCRFVLPIALLVATSNAQESDSSSGAPRSAQDVTVVPFTPRAFTAEELWETAGALFGQAIRIETHERDGVSGFATGPHFVQLGDLLLIRDTAQEGARIAKVLQSLEQAELDRRKLELDAEQEASAAPIPELTTIEVRPRYVSTESLAHALEGYRRKVQRSDGEIVPNLTYFQESGLLLVHELADRAKEIESLIARVDQPKPQMSVTAMLVEEGGEGELPSELAASLAQLVPGRQLGTSSVGLLRCSTSSGLACTLKMDLGEGDGWSLSFFPDAYNPETSELTVSRCEFELRRARPHPQPESVQRLTTNLTLRAGEHVVLGAVGADPTFVVVRIEPVRPPAARSR